MSGSGQAGGCGAPAGGYKMTEGGGREAVVQGHVTKGGAPLPGGYARLLNSEGEFVAEVPLGQDGGFRFFAAPGGWKLRVLAPGGVRVEHEVRAEIGQVTDIEVAL